MSLMKVPLREFFHLSKVRNLTGQMRKLCTFERQIVNNNNTCQQSALLAVRSPNLFQIDRRFKKTKKVEKILQDVRDLQDEMEDSDDDEDEDDYGKKTYEYKVGSLRIDIIAKCGVNTARNKIEKAFYEGRIYLNGQKVLKKGIDVKKDDVIDYIKGTNPNNNGVLLTRVTLLDWKLINQGYKIIISKENMESTEYNWQKED